MFSLHLTVFLFMVLSACAAQDVAQRRLHPIFILVVLAVGLVQGPPLFNAVLAVVFFGWSMLMWKARWLGGGDAKLLPAVVLAAPFPMPYIIGLSILMAVAGGIITVLPTRHRTDLLGKFPLAVLMCFAWFSQPLLLLSG